MPRDWSALAERSDGLYLEADFKQALHQLVVQQCLYLRQREHATAYRLISAHRDSMREAVTLLGLRLGFNDRLEFCYVAQDQGPQQQLDLQETLFLLTLRSIYHASASAGDMDVHGDVVVGIPAFEESYRTLCGRPFEARADVLRNLVRMAGRHGLAKLGEPPDGDLQPFAIVLLPGIVEVLSEHALDRFGAELKARLVVDGGKGAQPQTSIAVAPPEAP